MRPAARTTTVHAPQLGVERTKTASARVPFIISSQLPIGESVPAALQIECLSRDRVMKTVKCHARPDTTLRSAHTDIRDRHSTDCCLVYVNVFVSDVCGVNCFKLITTATRNVLFGVTHGMQETQNILQAHA